MKDLYLAEQASKLVTESDLLKAQERIETLLKQVQLAKDQAAGMDVQLKAIDSQMLKVMNGMKGPKAALTKPQATSLYDALKAMKSKTCNVCGLSGHDGYSCWINGQLAASLRGDHVALAGLKNLKACQKVSQRESKTKFVADLKIKLMQTTYAAQKDMNNALADFDMEHK